MKTRCVVLSSNAFPFMVAYWMKLFKKWENKVDKVYFVVSDYVEPSTTEFVRKTLEHPKIDIFEGFGAYPFNITKVIQRFVKEDLVLIVHDDTFIYDPQYLEECFQKAEKGFAVTPFDAHYTPTDVARPIFKKLYPDLPEYSFFLHFFFAPREVIMKADAEFMNNSFEKGVFDSLVGGISPGIGGDVAFGFGLRLFRDKVPFHQIALPPLMEILSGEDPLRQITALHPQALHVQALGYMFDELGKPPVYGHSAREKNTVTYRLAWIDEFMRGVKGIEDYGDKIKKARDTIRDYMEIKEDEIKSYQKILRGFNE